MLRFHNGNSVVEEKHDTQVTPPKKQSLIGNQDSKMKNNATQNFFTSQLPPTNHPVGNSVERIHHHEMVHVGSHSLMTLSAKKGQGQKEVKKQRTDQSMGKRGNSHAAI